MIVEKMILSLLSLVNDTTSNALNITKSKILIKIFLGVLFLKILIILPKIAAPKNKIEAIKYAQGLSLNKTTKAKLAMLHNANKINLLAPGFLKFLI